MLIQSTESMITSSNCGNLIISCQDDIQKCCHGTCCPLLNSIQKPSTISDTEPDEMEPQPPQYIYTPKPTPLICPKVGEQCSSQYGESSCCGENTKCRFDNYNYNQIGMNKYLLGTCCIEHNSFGCRKDSDCCKYDGICVNGYCQRNLYPNSETETEIEEEYAARGSIIQKLTNELNKNSESNDDGNDLHERNRSKPNYDIWISLTANTIFLYIVLMSFCIVFYCWYKKNVKEDNMRKVMNVTHIMVERNSGKLSNMECDIDESDDTDIEQESDEYIYSPSRER